MTIQGEVIKVEQASEFVEVTLGNCAGIRDSTYRAFRHEIVLSMNESEAKKIGIGRVAKVTVKFK